LALSQTFDDGLAVNYTYDRAGRLTGLTAGGTAVWAADEIDAAGRIDREHYGNGATQSYGFDRLGLTSQVTVASGGSSLYDVSVTRNAYGAPTLVVDNDNVGLDQKASYSYDQGGRLTGSTLGTPASGLYTFSYAYDALQNMILRTAKGPQEIGVLSGTYRYGERGYGPRQLTSVVPGVTP
jgi:hypothetical protein